MRKLLSLAGVAAFGLLGFAADGATTAKKKSGASTTSSAHKKSGTSKGGPSRSGTSRTTAAKRGNKSATRRTASTWRSRQLSPTPERYKEIQQALATKGYLTPEEANGKWDDTSAAALRKFQTDQNLDGNGKINSLSLIALGLGPKRETTAAVKPAAPPESAPAPTVNP
jgi:hypothetical protein